jgi:hypothetical protein
MPYPFTYLMEIKPDELYNKIHSRNAKFDIEKMLNSCPFYVKD